MIRGRKNTRVRSCNDGSDRSSLSGIGLQRRSVLFRLSGFAHSSLCGFFTTTLASKGFNIISPYLKMSFIYFKTS